MAPGPEEAKRLIAAKNAENLQLDNKKAYELQKAIEQEMIRTKQLEERLKAERRTVATALAILGVAISILGQLSKPSDAKKSAHAEVQLSSILTASDFLLDQSLLLNTGPGTTATLAARGDVTSQAALAQQTNSADPSAPAADSVLPKPQESGAPGQTLSTQGQQASATQESSQEPPQVTEEARSKYTHRGAKAS